MLGDDNIVVRNVNNANKYIKLLYIILFAIILAIVLKTL
jgi:hypothetical protein